MLSNCNHTKTRLIPRLVENLTKHGYVEMNKVQQVSELCTVHCSMNKVQQLSELCTVHCSMNKVQQVSEFVQFIVV